MASNNYGDWIDLFAWGTSGHGRKAHDSLACHFYPWEFTDYADRVNIWYNDYGFGPSYAEPQRATLNPSMSSDFDDSAKLNRYFDWGFYNNIREYSKRSSVDGIKYDSTMYFAGVWRTPTLSEWIYLLKDRLGVDNQNNPPMAMARIQYSEAKEDTINGLLLFPDDYHAAQVGVPKYAFSPYDVTDQPVYRIDASTWEIMDEAGVVFLPCAGFRDYYHVYNVGWFGYYWSSTSWKESMAYYAEFDPCSDWFEARSIYVRQYYRNLGHSVRLIQDIKKRK